MVLKLLNIIMTILVIKKVINEVMERDIIQHRNAGTLVIRLYINNKKNVIINYNGRSSIIGTVTLTYVLQNL